MKHSGKARKAALKLILLSLIVLLVVWAVGSFTAAVVAFIAAVAVLLTPVLITVIIALWVLFAVFTLYFFRDPNPRVPAGANLVLAPAHGKVDVIGTTTEPEFMGGRVPAGVHFPLGD